MGYVLFVFLVLGICVGWWFAVYAAPTTLSLIIPRGTIFFSAGFAVFAFGLGGTALAVYGLHSPGAFLGSLLTAFSGGWFMLAPTAAYRSNPGDARMMDLLALMLVALMCVLVLSFLAQPAAVAGLQLWLVLFGGAMVTRDLVRVRR